MIELIKSVDDFFALEGEWDDFVAKIENPSIFHSWDWLSNWLAVYAEGVHQILVIVVREAQEIVGIGPFVVYQRRHPLLGNYKELQFLGNGERESDSVVSEYMDVLCLKDQVAKICELVSQVLLSDEVDWDAAVFSRLLANARVLNGLVPRLDSASYGLERRFIGYQYLIRLPISWEQYLAQINASAKKQFQRKLRKAARTGALIEYTVKTKEQLPEFLDKLIRLHNERWQSQGEEGVFTSEAFLSFHRKLMFNLLRRGSLNCRWLELDGVPIAALYNFRLFGTDYFYQSGLASLSKGALSPGVLMHCFAIQAAIKDGYKRYDFMGGKVDSYKRTYANEKLGMFEVKLVGTSMKARLLNLEWRLKKIFRFLKTKLR